MNSGVSAGKTAFPAGLAPRAFPLHEMAHRYIRKREAAMYHTMCHRSLRAFLYAVSFSGGLT